MGYVFGRACMFVCVFVHLTVSNERICIKTFDKTCVTNPLHLGNDPDYDPNGMDLHETFTTQ